MRVSLPNLHLTGPLVFCEVLLGAHDKCYHKDVNVLNIVFGADIWICRKKLHMALYIWFSTAQLLIREWKELKGHRTLNVLNQLT